jgi:osmotically-inducible protein OsmY
MKKMNIFIHYVVLLALVTTLAACAATPVHESTGEYVDDSVITTKVKSLLAADDFLKSFQITVETYKGVVQLSGFVDSQKAIDKATEITKNVKGIKSVKNDLSVK